MFHPSRFLGVILPPVLCTAMSLAQPEAGAYATGHYRDLFAEQLSHAPDESRKKIGQTYDQLFHGDKQTQTLFYDAGRNPDGPLAYITDVANHDVRTEGMSYGMMIAVQMNKKRDFDAIWNWANTYMLITDPANPSQGYFAWSMHTDGTPRSDSPAPDGEEYFVMSLYFAANRWGNGTGIYNYKAEADRLLSLMRHHPVQTGTPPFRLKPGQPPFVAPGQPGTRSVGPMVNEQAKMILFVPGEDNNGFTDPSYHLPAFYELWSRWGPVEDRAFWADVAGASRAFFPRTVGAATSLSPDYANFDGTPRPSFNPNSQHFSYDSWRTASNWSVDYAWWHKDAQEPILSNRIQRFLLSQGTGSFPDQYTLQGVPLSKNHSTGLVATTAVASLAATPGPASKTILAELWQTQVPSGEGRYYDGMLYLLSLLHCSGNFRIWSPQVTNPLPAQRILR